MNPEKDEVIQTVLRISRYLENEFQNEEYIPNSLEVLVGCVAHVCASCEYPEKAFDRVRQHLDEYEEIYNRIPKDEMD